MSISILHSSDWHLGKKLFHYSRLDEQTFFLNWLTALLQKDKIDALMICGDIFDVPNPPHQALDIYFRFLAEVSQKTSTEIYIIAGNHDSGMFLSAPQQMLEHFKIHVVGNVTSSCWFEINRGQTQVAICLLPYFRSHEILSLSSLSDYDDLPSKIIENLKKLLVPPKHLENHQKVLMAHHLFGNFDFSGSEQSVFLSGIESLPLQLVSHFDYVALGHIHKNQCLKREKPYIAYSGSPLPFRFSEAKNKPQIKKISFEKQNLNVEDIAVPQLKKLAQLKTNSQDYQADLADFIKTTEGSLLEVEMLMKSPKVGIADEIRKELKNTNHELLSFFPIFEQNYSEKQIKTERHFNLLEAFQDFYQVKFGEQVTAPENIIQTLKKYQQKTLDYNENTQH